jgi:excisionase family DNA binding protein
MSPPAQPPRPRLTREDVAAAREVAELLRIPMSTVFEYARRGVIPGHKLGRRWIFLHDEIEASLRRAPALSESREAIAPAPLESAIRARKVSKRYPQTVPSASSTEQRPLFS